MRVAFICVFYLAALTFAVSFFGQSEFRSEQKADFDAAIISIDYDNELAIVGTLEGIIWLYDLKEQTSAELVHDGNRGLAGVEFVPHSTLAVAAFFDGTLIFFDTVSKSVVAEYPSEGDYEDFIWSLAISPHGQYLAKGGMGNVITVLGPKNELAFDPNNIVFMNSDHRSSCCSIPHIWTMRFSPDSRFLAVASTDATVKLWDSTSLEYDESFFTGNELITSLAFAVSSDEVILGIADGTIRILDISQKTEISRIEERHKIPTSLLAINSNRLAVGFDDGTIGLYDLHSSGLLHVFYGNPSPVLSLAFVSENSALLSGYENGDLRIWDLNDNSELNTIMTHIHT